MLVREVIFFACCLFKENSGDDSGRSVFIREAHTASTCLGSQISVGVIPCPQHGFSHGAFVFFTCATRTNTFQQPVSNKEPVTRYKVIQGDFYL